MQVLRVGPLPQGALAAAARFHAEVLPGIESEPGDLVLVFGPADHTHDGWRRAAIQQLARDRAPRRINALAGDDEPAIAAATAYLAGAPGVTGQLLSLDGVGAGAVLSSPE
ncbi:MAG TPA: hypothetical protein VF440_02915 [Novosphingobium sp.]